MFSGRATAGRRRRFCPVFAFTDEDRQTNEDAFLAHLPGGAVIICRFRQPDKYRAGILRLCRLARQKSIHILLAAPMRTAAAYPVAGVHLSENRLRQAGHRHRRRGGLLLTAAAHSLAALQRADAAGADFVFFSPVFPTVSHPDGAVKGATILAKATRTVRCSVVALGGIDHRTVPRLHGSGVGGIAGIGLFSESNPMTKGALRRCFYRFSRGMMI